MRGPTPSCPSEPSAGLGGIPQGPPTLAPRRVGGCRASGSGAVAVPELRLIRSTSRPLFVSEEEGIVAVRRGTR